MTLLKKRYIKREYEVETIDYTIEVPFYKPVFICEHTIDANDDFTPLNPTGLRNFKEPIPGSCAYYRIIGDGVHTPTFSGFVKASQSEAYVATALAVNLVTFFFDGVAFWYSITLVG